MSAFTAPSCLPQAVLSLRSATTTAPTMVHRRDALVIAGTTGASWMFGQQAAYAKTGGGAATKKAPAKPVEEEEEEEEEDTTPAGFQELKEGLKYKVVTEGKGAKAKIGDLVAIRFKSSYNGQVIDDCFKTPNSYYYRVGSENVIQVRVCARARMHARTHARTNVDRCSIQGLDLAVQNMKLGDRWLVKVPPALAFGDKGIKPSPGKPRIPGGATLDYEIFFEIYPGLEDDLMEE